MDMNAARISAPWSISACRGLKHIGSINDRAGLDLALRPQEDEPRAVRVRADDDGPIALTAADELRPFERLWVVDAARKDGLRRPVRAEVEREQERRCSCPWMLVDADDRADDELVRHRGATRGRRRRRAGRRRR